MARRKHNDPALYANHQSTTGALINRMSANLVEEKNKKLLNTLSIEEVRGGDVYTVCVYEINRLLDSVLLLDQ